MTIELIRQQPAAARHPLKLLFVHGVNAGAWVWQPRYLPYFAQAGFDTYALSLRGHGKSEGHANVRDFTLGDFAGDIEWAVKKIGGPVALIGHSLGGAVVQNYIRKGGNAAAAVLLSSVPPHGLLRSATIMIARNPVLAAELEKVLDLGVKAADPKILEYGLFSGPAEEDMRQWLHSHLCDMAATASREAMGWTPFAPLPWAMPKLLVICGEKDEFVPVSDVRLTSIYYGERTVTVPTGVHMTMLDRNWRDTAAPIAHWLADVRVA